LSRRSALQGRHLAERPDSRRQPHDHAPRDQADPGPVREVVGEELRRQAVAGIGSPGPNRDHEAGRADGARQHVWDECDSAEGCDRRDQPRAAGVVGVPRGSGPGQERDSHRHRADAQDLAPADRLAEHARADHQQDDQARRQDRFDERERNQQQRADLRHPAAEGEGGADQPARLRHQPAEQGEAKVLLLGRLASLERLQPDRRRV
jgi:hypothetical protein